MSSAGCHPCHPPGGVRTHPSLLMSTPLQQPDGDSISEMEFSSFIANAGLTWSSNNLGIPDMEQRDSEKSGLKLRMRVWRLGRRGGGSGELERRLWDRSREVSEAAASREDRERLRMLL